MTGARILVLLAALSCLAAAADPSDRLADPAQEARARAMFREIRCVVCQSESIDDSEADLARDLRQSVRRQIAVGHTDAQVRAYLVHRYGEFILLKPRFSPENAALWLTPFLIAGLGVGVFFWRARGAKLDRDDLTPEEEARLSELVER
jgi:cytochrome c-type biogenesis protein CcmH